LPALTPPPLAESPPLAIEPGVSEAAAVTADISPAAHDFSVILPGHRQEAVTERTFSVILSGGGAIGPGDSPVGTARLGVEWGFLEPWAVAFDGGFQSQRGATTNAG